MTANFVVGPSIKIRPCCKHVFDKTKSNDIKCSATGPPTPEVTWIFPNGSKWPDHRNTRYKNASSLVVTELDGGNYQCVASNNIGEAVESLTVFGM